MGDSPNKTEGEGRLPALDGLRGFAALFVMIYHFTMQIETPRQLPTVMLKDLFSLGWSGVDLFFVLSGFLITGLLLSAKGSSNYFRVFYGRRMLRILPLYYAALFLVFAVPAIVSLPGVGSFSTPFRDQAWFWFYLQNYHSLGPKFAGLTGPLWSLAIEEQFYVVWPLIVWLTSTRQALWVSAACVALSLAYRFFAFTMVPHLDTYYVTQARLDGLSIGSAIALFVTQANGLTKLRSYAGVVAMLAIVGVMIAGTNIRGPFRPAFPLLYFAVALLYGCLLVFALAGSASIPLSVLRSRVLRFFGKYSYALYVIHVPLMTILWHAGFTPRRLSIGASDFAGAVLYSAILLGGSTVLALLSWNLLEKHFLKLKRYFTYDRTKGNSKAPLSAAPLKR